MTEDVLAQARDKMRAYGIVDSGDAASGVGRHDRRPLGGLLRRSRRHAGVYPKTLDYARAYTLEFVRPTGTMRLGPVRASARRPRRRRGRLSRARRGARPVRPDARRRRDRRASSGRPAAASPRPFGCWPAWRRRRAARCARSAGAGRDLGGLPVADPGALAHRPGQRRPAARARRHRGRRGRRRAPRGAGARRACGRRAAPGRRSSPAAWPCAPPWPARWSPIPSSCCSTSPSRPWTRSPAARLADDVLAIWAERAARHRLRHPQRRGGRLHGRAGGGDDARARAGSPARRRIDAPLPAAAGFRTSERVPRMAAESVSADAGPCDGGGGMSRVARPWPRWPGRSLLLGGWEAACRRLPHIPLYLLPPPRIVVAAALVANAAGPGRPGLADPRHGPASPRRSPASSPATGPGGLPAAWTIVERAVRPLAVALQVTPVVAIAPLLVIWAGVDHPPGHRGPGRHRRLLPDLLRRGARPGRRRSRSGAPVRPLRREPAAAAAAPAPALGGAVSARRAQGGRGPGRSSARWWPSSSPAPAARRASPGGSWRPATACETANMFAAIMALALMAGAPSPRSVRCLNGAPCAGGGAGDTAGREDRRLPRPSRGRRTSPARQVARQVQAADPVAVERRDVIARGREHAPDLMVAALVDGEPGRGRRQGLETRRQPAARSRPPATASRRRRAPPRWPSSGPSQVSEVAFGHMAARRDDPVQQRRRRR